MTELKSDKRQLMAYTGSQGNVVSVIKGSFAEGKAAGMCFISVRTIGGMDVMILPDRGLDIAHLIYKGVKISFMSRNGIVSPASADRQKEGFVRYFTGGMLTTCGLRNVGPDCVDDNGEYHPTHGRYSLIQAEDICIERPDIQTAVISGTIRETALFGHDLTVRRMIRISDADSSISITDCLMNNSTEEEEIMVLYHYNFGYPFLQEGCEVRFMGSDIVTPRTPEAAGGIDKYTEISAPVDGYSEQVFFHEQQGNGSGMAFAEVLSPNTGISARLEYDAEVLPVLTQWKSMRSGDYALGLEPSNNFVMGRKPERANGTLKKIKPFEEIEFKTALRLKKI